MNLLDEKQMQLPDSAQYHWATEYARFWLKRSDRLHIPEIDFSISIKPSDIVTDCGAHIGSITSKLARTRATVYAFEPNSFCYRLLAKRFFFCPMCI